MREKVSMRKRVFYLIVLVVLYFVRTDGCNVREYKEELKEPREQKEQEVVQKPQQNLVPDEVAGLAYTENYAYSMLPETAREVYAEVLMAILEHWEKVEVSTTDKDVLEEAYIAVFSDYGGLYWVSGYSYTQYTRGAEVVGMDFRPQYTMSQAKRESIQREIDAEVKELLAGISVSDSDYEKAKYVFEVLVSNVDYDADVNNNQNIISVFLEKASVCQGYACATQYLLRILGIQSAIVTGSANGELHAWNLVRLDGDYYYMDTTWGDAMYMDVEDMNAKDMGDDYINYSYLAVTTEEINRTHKAGNRLVLPECVHMKNNYYVRENRYVSRWDSEEIGEMLSAAWVENDGRVSLKFSSLQLYKKAFQYFIKEQHLADYCENVTSVRYVEDENMYVLSLVQILQ